MFSSQNHTTAKDKDRKPQREAGVTPSIVSTDVRIEGNLVSTGEVQFDGTIDGDITCGTLTVGQSAQITGALTADRAIIHGTVIGSVRARVVSLHSTSRLEGDVVHEDLTVESGAFIEGRCLHVQNPLEEKTLTPQSALGGEREGQGHSVHQLGSAQDGSGGPRSNRASA